LRLEPGATRFVMQRTGRFAPLREGLGDRLVTFDGRWSAVWRHMVRTHGLREAWRRRLSPPAPVFVAQAEGNVARKVRRLPELARLPGFVAAYARRKAKHAEFLTDMLERLLADLPEPVAVVYNGSYVPDATLAAVAGAGRRVYIENGYFRGTIQADPLGINDDNSLPRDPGFYLRYQPDDRPLDMVLDTRDPKHGVQAAVGLPAGYVFVPFQVDSDSQITLHSPWVGSMAAFHGLVVEMAEALPDRVFVIKEHPHSRRTLSGRVAAHPRVIFQNGRNTQELIDGAGGVLTINSTVGVEALARGKPVAMVGRACYRIEGLVRAAENAEGLRTALSDLPDWRPDERLRRHFLHYLYYRFLLRNEGLPDGRDAGEVLLEVLRR